MPNFIITGVSSGIGEQLSQKILDASEDNFVIGLSRSSPSSLKNDRFKYVYCDLSSQEPFEGLINEINKIGINRIEYLVCNAGELINKPFEKISPNEIENIYKVNVFSNFQLIQLMAPYLLGNSISHVITIGSIGGINGSKKFPGLSAYSSSKAALTVLTECLAEEFQNTNIKFNCLALGSVNTKMLRSAFPDFISETDPIEMANFIFKYLVSFKSLVNGKVIPVSKGNP